jgi:hypothetical protein
MLVTERDLHLRGFIDREDESWWLPPGTSGQASVYLWARAGIVTNIEAEIRQGSQTFTVLIRVPDAPDLDQLIARARAGLALLCGEYPEEETKLKGPSIFDRVLAED